MRRPSRISHGSRQARSVQLCRISTVVVGLLVCGIYARFLWPSSTGSEDADHDIRTETTESNASAEKIQTPQQKLWLTIGIPTVPRRNDIDYLVTTAETLLQELPSTLDAPLYAKVRVIIMNNKKGKHVVFERAKTRVQNAGPDVALALAIAASHIEFVDNPGDFVDPFKGKMEEPDDLNNPSSRPGSAVRQQTCDLITLMEEALRKPSDYYMFMEDDFRTCGKALEATKYAIGLATEMSPSWLAMRVSYGMNGIVMRSRDLPPFSDFLREHLARLPPDLLWTGYLEGRTYDKPEEDTRVNRGPLMVFKHNLFDHIGTVSSFEVRPDRPKWPGCYESMTNVWSLQEHERFDPRCDEFDISPCIGLTTDSKAALIYKGGHSFEPP
eukprot:TRINITY_DN16097_c0_g2_i1.p1 TRINITY_DN16097_c0_g2~~TRINITY_DN16097_c0_g2_i1.p1  ORF type:complete len:384 (+),score=77.74 TRINITY_DN16097_c0_g2_i1:492-1643(+)